VESRTLGKSGLRVSEVGLGCWQLGGDFGPCSDDEARAVLEAADASAIRFWDTADVYGAGKSESRIGSYLSDSGADIAVATKVGRGAGLYPDGYTRDGVRASLEQSAQRLRVEQIDLAQLHCVPPDILKAGELLSWMNEFQQEGLIRAYGASVETIEEAIVALDDPGLTSLQIIFNIFRQNAIDQLFPVAEQRNVGIIVRLPLASGVLSGKMTRNSEFASTDHRNYNRDGAAFSVGETFSGIPFKRAVELADRIKPWVPDNMSMAQMAIRWILDHPAVSTVIVGASRPEQVAENAYVSSLSALPQSLHDQLSELYKSSVEPEIRVTI
jgi:aryl-alcohol dehydrogenase-like predicted oxidoreductase